MGYSDIESAEKNKNNETIARWAKFYLGKGRRYHALVLDGPDTRTSKKLIENNLTTSSMIYAPQYDDKDAEKMRSQRTCVVIRSTLSRVARSRSYKIPTRLVQIFNLDFTGSIFGRQKTPYTPGFYPLQDTYDCLLRTEQDDVILSVTVADRHGNMTREEKFFEGREDFGDQINVDFLVPVINACGFKVIDHNYHWYSRTSGSAKMWFFIYYIHRDGRYKHDSVDFAIHPKIPKLLWGFNPDFPSSYAK